MGQKVPQTHFSPQALWTTPSEDPDSWSCHQLSHPGHVGRQEESTSGTQFTSSRFRPFAKSE